jgi:hypothetical protein
MGGAGDEGRKKYPKLPKWFFNTKVRDWGCPLMCLAAVMLVFKLDVKWYWHVASFLFTFGALTTYWDFLFNDKDNFWMHGFMCGLAYFPYAIATGDLLLYLLRAFLLAELMQRLSNDVKWPDNDDIYDEMSRGAVLVATLALLIL